MMNDSPNPGGHTDVPELWLTLEELEAGTLDPTRCAELENLLDRSPAARRAYLEYFQQSSVLRMEAAKLHERGLLPVVGSAFQTRRMFQRSVLATAAILMITAVVMTFIIVKPFESDSMKCAVVRGTEWRIEGSGPGTREIAEGASVSVASGMVRMELESGATMVLRGPAEVRFPELHRPELSYGWLWIDSGVASDSFEVRTPAAVVRDIGTRFGVRVREGGGTEVHLIEGEVEVAPTQPGAEPILLQPEDFGMLLAADATRSDLPLAHDPFPDLPDLLQATAGYRTTVLSQGPAGYWRLDTPSGKHLKNEIASGSTGYRGNEALPGEPGVGHDGKHDGFAAENRSIRLSGDPVTSVITKIDMPGGISREEGGVSFWLRSPSAPGSEQVLWLAGKTPDEQVAYPREALMHTRLSSSGRVELLVENGDFDVLLASNFSVSDGRWHHIAASWSPSAVELYVDGRQVASSGDFGRLKEGIMQGDYVRFGKPSGDLAKEGKTAFTGWVDEIALWSRPLDPAEIARQFAAATDSE